MKKRLYLYFKNVKINLFWAKVLEIQHLSTLDIIRNESHFLKSLSSDLFNIYNNLIFKIEQKYWVFYRVHIQALARYKEMDETNFPEIFLEDNLVACLFFCEKLIAKLFLNESQKEKILALYIESLFNSSIYNILTLLHIFLNTPIENLSELINEFAWLIYLILKKLPNSSWVLEKWQTWLSFVRYPWTNIFDEKICSTNTIH